MKKKSLTLFFAFCLLISFKVIAQPAGALPAKPNIIYYAGGSCIFYDKNSNVLLSVDANEAGWSATPANAAWVVVTPNNAGYYEFPNYTNNLPTCNAREYIQPFWSADTIFNELVLLSGLNSSARLMFTPKKIIKVTNYDFSKTFVENTDYSVSGNKIIQKSATLSATYSIKAGVKGNGQSNGLMNVSPTSWTCVSYIPDRTDWKGNAIITSKGHLLPKFLNKLNTKQAVTIEAFGMSITAGLNVSGFAGDNKNFTPTRPYMHSYVDLFGEEIGRKYNTSVNIINGSCGGKMVAWIDKYCKEMVNPNNPDLVILDMGMNDIWGTTSNAAFKASMQSCIAKIKQGCPNAEFILIGNMLPDIKSPGSPLNGETLMYGFLQELKSLETEGIVVFDMTTLSDTIYRRKGATHCHSNSLHPNDYLARWYAQGLINTLNVNTKTGNKYYVNTSGNNTDGLTIATAWTDLNKVNNFTFKAGDTILLEGGKTFTGHINLDASDANSTNSQLVIKSYGPAGKAKIKTNSISTCGLKATNCQGVTIENLIFEGPGTTLAKDFDGIQFYSDLPTGKLYNISLSNVEVFNFGYCGIRFVSKWDANVKSGFSNVKLNNCKVHDCRENGIVSIAYDNQNTQYYNHDNFHISNSEVYSIPGYSASSHKGSGIVLSQIDSALIEYSSAHHTGAENTACGGPGGIWVWSANRVNIQYCESHHNSSGLGKGCDGLGFDLDGGVTNSKIQYCYSHDNDGAGILLGNFDGARPWGNNIVRYNISVNDALTNNSPVTLFTAPGTSWNTLFFYNNTIIAKPSLKNSYPGYSAFQLTDYGNSMKNIHCYNNILLTDGNLPFIHVPLAFTADNPKFAGNLYWSLSNNLKWNYGNNMSTSLVDFRNSGSFCEKYNNTNTGLVANPEIIGLTQTPPVLFPLNNSQLSNYKTQKNSPCINAGINLTATLGLSTGNIDFWGNPIKKTDSIDIGAFEYQTTTNFHLVQYLSKKIFVKPNPASSNSVILTVPENALPDNITLMGIDGRIKHNLKVNKISKSIFEIDINNIPSGTYIIKFNNSNLQTMINERLIILH